MSNFAITIGINDYLTPENNGLKNLNGAVNDALAFETWVKDPNGGNVPEENSFLIVSKAEPLSPIKEEIDEAFVTIIQRIMNNGGEAERLYFYFAGHGLGTLGEGIDTALCLPKWSQIERNYALSSKNYNDSLRQYGYFKEIIFFIDCCRNTKVSVRPQSPSFEPILEGDISRTKIFIGYGTNFQNRSFEFTDEDLEMRGIFTKVLIEALNGAAADDNGLISAQSLKSYLDYKVPRLAMEQGYTQTPEIIHSFTEESYFNKIQNMKKVTRCKIKFSDNRNSTIELFGDLGLVETFDSARDKEVEIDLSKGLYVLIDPVSEEEKSIKIFNLNEDYEVIF